MSPFGGMAKLQFSFIIWKQIQWNWMETESVNPQLSTKDLPICDPWNKEIHAGLVQYKGK